MPNPDRVDLELIELIYDIPLKACDWDTVIARLRHRMMADAGTLVVYGRVPGSVSKICLSGHDDAIWRDYAAHFAAIDPFRDAMETGLIRPGSVTSDTRVLPRRQFETGEYYNDFWRRNRLGYSAGGHALDAQRNWVQVGLPRPLGAPDYTDQDLRELGLYFRNIRRALQLERAITKRDTLPDLDAFAVRHRLTPSEVKVVEALIETGSLPRAAVRLRRSHNTLRAHLRSILDKTATSNQVQLMTLVHRPAASDDHLIL